MNREVDEKSTKKIREEREEEKNKDTNERVK